MTKPSPSAEELERSLEDALAVKAALDEKEAELAALYREIWPLREAHARMTPPAELPAPRYRTDKQNAVARCPRCGGKLDEGIGGT